MPPSDWAAPDAALAPPVRMPPPAPAPAQRPASRASFRPRGIFELLDDGFRLVRERPRTCALLAVVIVVPVQLLGVAASSAFGREPFDPDFQVVAAVAGGSIVPAILASVSLALLGAAMTPVAFAWREGSEVGVGGVLRTVLRRSVALVLAWAVVHALEVAAALPCFIGLPFVMPLLVVVAPAIAGEGLGPVRGVRRSVALAGARYWRSFGFVFSTALVSTLVAASAGLLAAGLAQVGGVVPAVIGTVVQLATATLATLVVAAAAALHYLDLRVRTEALDLVLALAPTGGPR